MPAVQTPPPMTGAGLNFGFDDLMKVIQDSKDPREVAYTQLVNHLWDRTKLKMIARLDKELFFYSVKNLIVIAFFQKYWCQAEAIITITPIDEPSLYRVDVKYIYPYDDGKLDPEYMNMVSDIWELTISKSGLGRSEILKLIDRSGDDMSVKENLQRMIQR